MTPTIVLPDGDPHMAALLSRPDFAARLDRLGGARRHADLPSGDDEMVARIGVVGTPEQCAAEIDRRFGAHASDVCCYFPGYNPPVDSIADLVSA